MQHKVNISFTFCLSVFLLSANAVFGQTSFHKFYGSPSNSEIATAVAELPGGGFVFTGQSGSHQPDNDDIFLTRTDANGLELWTVYFGAGNNEVATAVAVASDGGFFISGYAQHLDGVDSEGLVLKTDANGALLWKKNLVLAGPEQVTALAATPDGGCIFTINGSWSSPGDPQASVVKFDQNGVQQWQRDYSAAGETDEIWAIAVNPDGITYTVGGNFNGSSLLTKINSLGTLWTSYPTDTIVLYGLFVQDLAINPVTGNIAVVGHSVGTSYLNLFSPGGMKLWAKEIPSTSSFDYEQDVAFASSGAIITTTDRTTVVFSPDGNILAETAFGTAQNYMVIIRDVIGTSNGDCLHAGLSIANFDFEDAALLLSNNLLQEQWHQTYGQKGVNHSEEGWMVRQTPDGGYILAGVKYYEATGTDYYLVKTNSQGAVEWENHYGTATPEYCRSAEPTPDGGYILSGYSTPGTGLRWYVVKTNASGVPLWEKIYNFGSISSITSSQVLPLPDGGYIGYAGGTLTGATPTRRALLVRLDSSGDTLWTRKAGDSASDRFRHLSRTSDGGFVATGWNAESATDLGGAWIVKFNANGTQLWEKTLYATAGGTGIGYSVAELANGALAFSAYLDNDGVGNDSLYLARYSAGGTTLFEKFFNEGGVYTWPRMHKDANNDLVIKANYGKGLSDSLLILKTDLNGNVIWRKTHKVAAYQFLVESQNTSDGGSVTIGIGNKGNTDDILLIKTNASGELVDTYTLLKNRPQLTASPVPSAGPVDLTLECEQTGQVIFRLFNPAGKLVFEKVAAKAANTLREPFDFSTLPAGTYFWQASIGAQSAGLQWVKQ